MSKTDNDTRPATKRTIKQCLSIWSRNKITAWFVIAASFTLVVSGGFLLGWRNVLARVVFGAAATLFGGLLLKYLDWQMKEKQRLELKRAERDEADRIIADFQDALSAYKEAEKIRDRLPEEQKADFEMPIIQISHPMTYLLSYRAPTNSLYLTLKENLSDFFLKSKKIHISILVIFLLTQIL